ncbi:MAG: FG-GAP repeat domain-containing protein [Candidatus Acidiferrales bacterium]
MARASLGLFCLCAFALALGGNAARAAQGTSDGASGFSPRFAIADFDGDQKPDLATVQVVREAALDSFYSIRLQLSAGEESAIGIAGPQGGLELVARDVNGDDLIDLVVTTAMGSHFVAILLNDGHGKFTLAKPGAFPSIENEQGIHLVGAQYPAEECAALQLTRSTFGIEAFDDVGAGLAHKSKFSLAPDCSANLPGVRPGKSGRSPPLSVLHS